jgi:hypothetical protein
VVVSERGQERVARRLVDELEIMGFSVTVRSGSESSARAARSESEADAFVFVSSEQSNLVWVPGDGSEVPRRIDGAGESPERLALRTAEHLRGHLLKSAKSDEGTTRDAGEAKRLSRFSIAGGPAVVYSRDASAAVAWSADAALWFGWIGFGPFILADLESNKWVPAPKEFEVRQLSTGMMGRAPFLMGPEFRAEALAQVGWRRTTVRRSKGPEKDQFQASSGSLVFGGGVQATYLPRPFYGIGAELLGQIGIPLSEPGVPQDLPKKQQEAMDAWVRRKSVDGLFQTSVVVMFFF